MELNLIIPTTFQVKKKPEIIDTVEKNYRISRRVYQSLFVDIATVFLNIFVH